MDRSRPGCCKADPDLPGELGCRAGHEGRHLFMADLHEVDGALSSIQRGHEAPDAVARVAEHPPHAPGMEAHPDEIRNGLRHGYLLGCETTFGKMRCCGALLERCFLAAENGIHLVVQWSMRAAAAGAYLPSG